MRKLQEIGNEIRRVRPKEDLILPELVVSILGDIFAVKLRNPSTRGSRAFRCVTGSDSYTDVSWYTNSGSAREETWVMGKGGREFMNTRGRGWVSFCIYLSCVNLYFALGNRPFVKDNGPSRSGIINEVGRILSSDRDNECVRRARA